MNETSDFDKRFLLALCDIKGHYITVDIEMVGTIFCFSTTQIQTWHLLLLPDFVGSYPTMTQLPHGTPIGTSLLVIRSPELHEAQRAAKDTTKVHGIEFTQQETKSF
jgi:hypothetical protein